MIHTGESSGKGVVIEIQRDSKGWVEWRGCWKYGIGAGEAMIVFPGLDEEEGCNAVLVGGKCWDGFPVIIGAFLIANRPVAQIQ